MSTMKRKRVMDSGDATKARKGDGMKIKDEVGDSDSLEVSKENSNNISNPSAIGRDDSDEDVSDVEDDEMEVDGDASQNSVDLDSLPLTDDEEGDDIMYEAGSISEVYMENFMNHRKFSLKLGKLVNFITGQNGSGKSACVAAIQLCLGATASKTGRASNMAKMVRHGSPGPAICRVKLLNSGDDAYKPEKYGREITVERKITRQGVATYSISGSKSSKPISHDKIELEKILQNFNIYVDNPCCILTQEQSKTFINGHEKEKYIFFLKATGLERVNDELLKAHADLDETKDSIANSRESKVKKKEALHSLQTTMTSLKALDKHEDDIQECIGKTFWCDVQDAEQVVETLESKKAAYVKNLNLAEKRLLDQEKKLENLGSNDDAAAVIEELENEQKGVEKTLVDAAQAYKEKMILESECKVVLQTLQGHLDVHRQRLKDVRDEIATLQAVSMKDAAESERIVLEKIESCRVSLNQAESDSVQADAKSRETSTELERAKATYAQTVRQRDHSQRAMDSSKRELSDMQREGSSGRLNRFHNNMSSAVSDMKATSFQSNVCGPLGVNILLKDEHKHLGSAVEKGLWHSLSSFVVDNSADRFKLSNILKKYNLNTTSKIFMQSKRPRYRVNVNRDVPNAVYLLDTIQVESDTVFNALVDQDRIDQIVITQTERESDANFVTTINGNRQFLPGISQAITMDGRTISYRNGNKASEQTGYHYKKLLAADTSEIIANLTNTINRDEAEIAEINSSLHTISQNVSQLEKQRRLDEADVLRSSKEMQKFRKILSDLQVEYSDLQTTNSAGQTDFVSLEAEAVDLADAISEVERRLENANSDLQSARQEMKECLAEKRRLESKRKAIKAKQNEQQEIIENHINIMQGLSRDVDKASNEVEKLRKTVAGADLAIEEKLLVVKEKTETAVRLTPEHIKDWDGKPLALARNDNRENLNKKMNRLKGMIEEGKRKAGLEGYTMEILTHRIMLASEDYETFRREHDTIKSRSKHLSKDIESRVQMWNKQVKHYSKLVSRSFDTYMQQRGFSGTVEFDHKNHLLTVKSQTDNANDSTRCTNLKQMSGGERSYTALCLLLALGHVIECPFRLMDEYDVFLDQVARKLTLDILANYALGKEQKGRQFIIITPQDLRHMTTSNEVRIHKMPDPERINANVAQQQTLDF